MLWMTTLVVTSRPWPLTPISGDLFVTGHSDATDLQELAAFVPEQSDITLGSRRCTPPRSAPNVCYEAVFVDRWTPAKVQAFVGHADARTTLRIYAKVNSAALPVPSAFEHTTTGPM